MFDLLKIENTTSLTKRSEAYVEMVNTIQQTLPMIKEATTSFGKTQSQFMDNFLTVSHPTPLRNARQILAQVNKSVEGLKEAQYNLNKKRLNIQRLERSLETETDDITRQELELEIAYESNKMETSMLYVEGAIRSITNYTEQYKEIMKNAGYNEMSEVDFEKEEEKYHIMKAFEQAICAARARGGAIDEGNHIYFSQIGVNGQMAQNFITKYFEQERAALEKGATLTGTFQRAFLEDVANYFKGCSTHVAQIKGMSLSTEKALIPAKAEVDKKSHLYEVKED